MGNIFRALVEGLGSVLGFFYDLLDFMSEGVALGFSIILLTIFINLLVFPLTLKQTRATRAFSALQPEIKRIQAQYKDDPQEMQKRLMELQKSAGATPGGCLLPLLVQMPIWFALFRLLQTPLDYLNPEGALGVVAGRPRDADRRPAIGCQGLAHVAAAPGFDQFPQHHQPGHRGQEQREPDTSRAGHGEPFEQAPVVTGRAREGNTVVAACRPVAPVVGTTVPPT